MVNGFITIAPTEKRSKMSHIVLAVVGRVLRVRESGKEDDGSALEYTIAKKASVTLNGKKSSLADISNGDEVEVSNGSKDGYHKLVATRAPNAPPPTALSRDLSKPREVQRVDPDEVNTRTTFESVPSEIPATEEAPVPPEHPAPSVKAHHATEKVPTKVGEDHSGDEETKKGPVAHHKDKGKK